MVDVSRRLSTIARELRETYPELRVTLGKWKSDTDGHVAGTRFRRQGKGRVGTHLCVYYQLDVEERRRVARLVSRLFDGQKDALWEYGLIVTGQRPLFEHRAGDTYRTNAEVEHWTLSYAACARGKHRKFFVRSNSADLCCICRRVLAP